MQDAGCNAVDIFVAAKVCFQLDDKQVVAGMLDAGLNHEEALQAMLAQ